jgi:serine/threonine protein kinase
VDENLRVVVSGNEFSACFAILQRGANILCVDFGFAEKLRQGRSTYDDRGTWKGTSFFMAPEVLTVRNVFAV